ncbi:MAG: DUF3471 domain-containing protein [Pyrinomonadaceae bacterium]
MLPPSAFILPPSSFPLAQRKPNPVALKKYAGRYQLEVGLIPISTLDVSLENDELWIKPSLQQKRKLLHKSKTVFIDEVEGRVFTFNKNEEGEVVGVTFEYEGGSYVPQFRFLCAFSVLEIMEKLFSFQTETLPGLISRSKGR